MNRKQAFETQKAERARPKPIPKRKFDSLNIPLANKIVSHAINIYPNYYQKNFLFP